MATVPAHDVAVVGAGPAGLIAARLAACAGMRTVLIEAAPDRRSPQGDHVHRIDDATWTGLESLVPSLSEAVAAHGAPVAPCGADALDAPLGDRERAFPDRHQLDAALRELCLGRGVAAVSDRVRDAERRGGCWCVGSTRARWLIDASGGARATLRPAARHGEIAEVLSRSEHAYVSHRVERLAWPDVRVGHAARAGGAGLVVRRISADRSLVTLQLADAAACPASTADLLEHAAVVDPVFWHERLRRARPVGRPLRWASRRASGLEADPDTAPPRWLAIGDALLTTPPHQGQGIAQIAEQMTILDDALQTGSGGISSARERLFSHSRQRLLAAALADNLQSPGLAAPG